MSLRFAVYAVAFVVVLGLATFLVVLNRPAYRQTATEVVIRQPGDRFLGKPESAGIWAREDLPFAWLSQEAYNKIPPPKGSPPSPAGCQDPYTALGDAGWKLWSDFPSQALQDELTRSHLRVEVWSNVQRSEVVVTFGGTVAKSLPDWEANLRWFFPIKDDEYTKLLNEVEPRFVQEFLARKQQQEYSLLSHASLYSTGHSLGAGLAEEFAYGLPIDPGVPRVTKVYAFDPTPVTAYTDVPKELRESNRKTLAIDRIYERGEILAILRSVTNFFDKPRATEPIIRQLRYSLLPRKNPIAGHSISKFACRLNEISQN
jgi:hypothetical protein